MPELKNQKIMLKQFIKLRVISYFVILLTISACANVPSNKSNPGEQSEDQSAEQGYSTVNYQVSETIKQQYSFGIEAMKQEDYLQAIQIFTDITTQEPGAAGPWINIAIAQVKLDQIDKADEAIEKAVKLNSSNPYALNQAGIIKRKKGDFSGAEEMYRAALAEYPNYAIAHLNLAILCDLYLKKIVCARSHYQAYQEIEKSDDKNVVAWLSDLSRRESQVK